MDRGNRRLIPAEGHVQTDTVACWAIDAVNRGQWYYEDLAVYQVNILLGDLRNMQREANSAADFDTLIARLQTRWSREYAAHFSGADRVKNASVRPQSAAPAIDGGRLSSKVYDYVVKRESGWDSNMGAFSHILASYWLPAFLDEYQVLCQRSKCRETRGLARGKFQHIDRPALRPFAAKRMG